MAETSPAREMRVEALKEITPLIDLAIRRSRASTVADPELKNLILGALEATKQELVHLKNVTEPEDRPGKYRKTAREPLVKEGQEKVSQAPGKAPILETRT